MKRENSIIIDVGNKEKNIVIGIEGGGTKTRAMAARLNGSIIGYAETGCSNPNKDECARENVREVMEKVLEAAGARRMRLSAYVRDCLAWSRNRI
ncbi:hypothetical protein [Paenibacillus apiarius]|uniref:ROK family protein n=1 Tax=Paenibacillus apiarius TaxID=46240 RepID=A0ABT4DN14_9BACL|nr:hypothetical protein [Paenibacillus apiarius]MCY9514631.1 hypothetical protein [Paenibacillus apiarius]MCY9518621.1 hypothetical protein [Paenibacillus apiarius]MCY9552709.1 hypothetical protein [Paenibacillus apiarius]MCY9556963.1 hypothetical protein [Paenibacillus apiarius]MCY9686084.1 hypothetical protein [Paenibacillus apiarius]